MQTKQAFTLVELAIVLVIIGLIVGGVLVGKELIRQAEYRAQINQLKQIDEAKTTFQTKYNGLPGDLRNVTDFGLHLNRDGVLNNCLVSGTPYNYNGSGNGIIEDIFNGTPGVYDAQTIYNGETRNFMIQLYNAGLTTIKADKEGSHWCQGDIILTAGNSYAKAALKPAMSIAALQHADSKIYYVLGQWGSGAYWYEMTNLQDIMRTEVAYALDSKLDDALPLSGSVRVISAIALIPGAGHLNLITDTVDSSANCTYNAAYNLNSATAGCTLAIRAAN